MPQDFLDPRKNWAHQFILPQKVTIMAKIHPFKGTWDRIITFIYNFNSKQDKDSNPTYKTLTSSGTWDSFSDKYNSNQLPKVNQ